MAKMILNDCLVFAMRIKVVLAHSLRVSENSVLKTSDLEIDFQKDLTYLFCLLHLKESNHARFLSIF